MIEPLEVNPLQLSRLFHALARNAKRHGDMARCELLAKSGIAVEQGADIMPDITCERIGEVEILFRSEILDRPPLESLNVWNTDIPITATIESLGGSAAIALQIARAFLKRGNVTTVVKRAASAATILAQGGSRRLMHKTATQTFHLGESVVIGDAIKLRRKADELERLDVEIQQFFCDRAGLPLETVQSLHRPGENVTLSSENCLRLNLCDELID